jgi:hypothetical protein
MKFEYYYNDIPGIGLCRNNLIYTSLISTDKKTFVQWYYNDTEYHRGQNEVIDPDKMEEKWNREIHFLNEMSLHYPDMIPEILDIDNRERKIYLKIEGLDFWNRARCTTEHYDSVLPDWQEQMIEIIEAHKSKGWHKYSMHPSSYFIVDNKLKSINYFFTYHSDEPNISIKEVESHIHSNRQAQMKMHLESLNIQWNKPQLWSTMDQLCWESFRNNYPDDFIEKVKCII